MSLTHTPAGPKGGDSDPIQRDFSQDDSTLRHFTFGNPSQIRAYIRLLPARKCIDARRWSLIQAVPEGGLTIKRYP